MWFIQKNHKIVDWRMTMILHYSHNYPHYSPLTHRFLIGYFPLLFSIILTSSLIGQLSYDNIILILLIVLIVVIFSILLIWSLLLSDLFFSYYSHIVLLSHKISHILRYRQALHYLIVPKTVWPHWGVRTVSVKERCLIEVVAGACGPFPVNFTWNGSSQMSMCVSTVQARTKRCPRDWRTAFLL